MTLILAGDIGGTKTILRLVDAHAAGAATLPQLDSLYEDRFVSAEFIDLVPMVRQFLQAASTHLETEQNPDKACFAIAGPVVKNSSNLTNLSWFLETDRLSQQLSIPKISLINDFTAVGYGVLGLEPDDLHTLQAGKPQSDAPIAVIGAGTGLGQGFLVRRGDDYHVFPSEGGHADFAPRSELEFQLLKYLLEKHTISRVSVERVVSGQGIIAMYQFLRDRQIFPESPDIADQIHTWERERGMATKTVDPASIISKAALEGRDRLCEQVMNLFVTAYGAEAGNVALKLLPYGGLYIAGGIAAKNLPLMQTGTFLHAFVDKGRMTPLLEQVPVHIILNPHVGLLGAAICAATMA